MSMYSFQRKVTEAVRAGAIYKCPSATVGPYHEAVGGDRWACFDDAAREVYVTADPGQAVGAWVRAVARDVRRMNAAVAR